MAGKTSKKSAKVAKKAATKRVAAKAAKPRKTAPKAQSRKVALLSGGNPQIAKADGDAPVQAYIAAMPGWKRDVGFVGLDTTSKKCSVVTEMAPGMKMMGEYDFKEAAEKAMAEMAECKG